MTHKEGFALYRARTKINSKALGNFVRVAIGACDLNNGRLFHCAEEAMIIRDSNYYWHRSQDFYQKECPLELAFDSTDKSSDFIFDWLQAQWNDESSELRFSWEWNRKREREQIRWIGTFVPRWNELHDLMDAISSIAELPIGEHWMLDHVDTYSHATELLERLQPWRKLLKSHFSFEPLAESYPLFLREYFRSASIHVWVKGVETSAHEQLEARLLLRDWLQINAPDHLHFVQ